jgi:hypothetical protein
MRGNKKSPYLANPENGRGMRLFAESNLLLSGKFLICNPLNVTCTIIPAVCMGFYQ